MRAQALITTSNQQFSLEPVTLPDPAPDKIVIKTAYSGVSIGTEFALIRNKISWGPYPLCTGYMGTGTVESAGNQTTGFKPGDKVFFRANGPMSTTASPAEKISAVSGAHCSHIVLDNATAHGSHGIDLLPENAPIDITAMFAVAAVGHLGTEMADPHFGQHVVVNGAGLIGLSVIAACANRGCVITAIDINPKALAIAKLMGADYLVNSRETNPADHVEKISPGGADVVFESTGIPALIDPSIALCRPFGSFVWQGNYGSAPISLHFLPPHGKRLKMFFPCDDGGPACRKAVVKNMTRKTLPWQHAITHTIPASQAPATFTQINHGAPDHLGVLINWN